MALVQTKEVDFLNVKKCGEITTLLSIGKNEFFLNCGFCEYTFLQLENFIRHICEDHLGEFQELKFKEENCQIHDGTESANLCKTNDDELEDDNDYCFRGFERVEIQLDSPEENHEFNLKEGGAVEIDLSKDDSNINSFDESSDTEGSDNIIRNDVDTGIVTDEQAINIKNIFPVAKMQAIFSSYVEHSALWDKEIGVVKSSKKRKQLFKSISSDVGLPDEWENIWKLLKKLRIKLHAEITRKMVHESNGQVYTPAWYTDITSFLKQRHDSTKKSKRKTKMGDLLPCKSKDVLPLMSITNEQCVILAELYKKFPCLWDETDITYRFKNRREDALALLHKEFNTKSGLNLTRADVESQIGKLRKICSNEKTQKLMCSKSKPTYKSSCPYYKYIAFIEVDVGPFECSECGKFLPNLGQYQVHLSSHDGSLPYKCHVCGHEFKTLANLTVHLRRHVHDYTYICKMCDKSFATSTDLKCHMRSHTGEKPYFCAICGKRLQTASLFSTHMQKHENRPRHKCEICSKPFYTKALLREHMNVHSNIRDKICNICNKGFSSGKHLRQHKQIHATKKKYLCKICDKRFAQCAGLSGHMKSHGTTLTSITNSLE